MAGLLRLLDRRTSLMVILLLFWGLFWLLNGGDKFFNSSPGPNLDGWSRKGVLTETGSDTIIYDLHPTLPDGFYGVTRDEKMENYFGRLGLPAWVALTSVYGIAILEVLLGLGFLVLFCWTAGPNSLRERGGGLMSILTDRTLHRLCFKTGMFIFLMFSVGDILFGDRTELWEHGTFMILTLVTYDMWYRTDEWSQQQTSVAIAL
ncbi:MAG: hypothetical protein V3V01_05830 [Acidimicrobiales bacterium]